MAQDGNGNTTEPPEGGNPFPTISETVVGAGLVQTADARDLHRFLKVGRDFSNWIKARLDKYGFVENVDYVKAEGLSSPNPASAKSRPQMLMEYHLTLDTAKEIAMVENNEQGRAARRYFIECERRAKGQAFDPKVIGGVTKGVIIKALGDLVPSLVRETVEAVMAEKRATPALDFAETVSAYQVIAMAGIAPADRQRGTAQMVTSHLVAFCARRQVACLRTPAILNPAEPYRFPYDMVCEWLMGAPKGLELIRNQIERAKARKVRPGRNNGQGALSLVPPA